MLGIGFYNTDDAARLIRIKPDKINRWLGGYSYKQDGKNYRSPPLWEPDLPRGEHHIELSFRDLMELRFVKAFTDSGLSVRTIRNCINYARECVNSDRPFSTQKFKTDGRTIFLQSAKNQADKDDDLLDLKNHQYSIKTAIERSFKDLDVDAHSVLRWWPYEGKKSIVIDPKRSFGEPILAKYGIPTRTVFDAVRAEDSSEMVSKLYEIPISAINDAIKFEKQLLIP